MHIRGFVLLAAAMSALPVASFADTTASVSSYTYGSLGGGADVHSNSGASGVPSSAHAFSERGVAGLAPYSNAAGSASASEGVLTANATAYAATPSGPYSPSGAYPYPYPYYLTMRGDSYARASWNDYVTVSAPGLAGTSGYITATIGFSGGYGGIWGNTGTNDTAEHYARANVLGTGMGGGDPACGGWNYCGFEDPISWGSGTAYHQSDIPSVIKLKIPVLFGYQTGIGYTLDLTVSASVLTESAGFGTSATAFNYSDTMKWNGITGVYDSRGNSISNFTVSSGSGFDYLASVTPVPEPETHAMLLAGLGLLGFMTWRKKQQA